METNSILTANILDIVFEGRNKMYGAYDLRKTYDKRIGSALGITISVILIFTCIVMITTSKGNKTKTNSIIEMTLSNERMKEKIILPQQKLNKTIALTPPLIVKDNLVIKPPVTVEQLIEQRIDTKTNDGIIDNTTAPLVETKGISVIESPVKKEDIDNVIIDVVQIEAKFKGDWGAYVKKEIEKNIDELVEAGESGTCVVRFVVSKDGSVSNVEAITMKGTRLAEVAVNAIRKGPKWIPAIQNGTQVNAYRQQPVTFKITD